MPYSQIIAWKLGDHYIRDDEKSVVLGKTWRIHHPPMIYPSRHEFPLNNSMVVDVYLRLSAEAKNVTDQIKWCVKKCMTIFFFFFFFFFNLEFVGVNSMLDFTC